MVRLSVDELVFARHGRYGVDYHESEYFAKEAPIVEEVYARLEAEYGEGLLDGRGQLGALAEGPGRAGQGR